MHIQVSGAISISANAKTVFEYLADLENDKFWRKEITGTSMNTKPQLNARATETSYLSKRAPSSILELICTEFSANQKVVYQTLPESELYLQSSRVVSAVSANQTQVTYALVFDKRIATRALGFNLPSFIIELAAKQDLKKYLRKLKEILESRPVSHILPK